MIPPFPRITVREGNATYSSRFLKSMTYKRNTEAGTITVAEFGTAPTVPEEKKLGFFSKLVVTDCGKKKFGLFSNWIAIVFITDNCTVHSAHQLLLLN